MGDERRVSYETFLVDQVTNSPEHVQFAVLEALGHEACERDRRENGEATVEADSKRKIDLETDARLHQKRADAYAEWLAEHDDDLDNYAGELRSKARDLERMREKLWDLLAECGDDGWL
jgi:chromosome segregation ATPase